MHPSTTLYTRHALTGAFNQVLVQTFHASYFYFSLISRLPLFATFVSLLALATFMLAMAYAAWPSAVLAACGVAGVLLALQV